LTIPGVQIALGGRMDGLRQMLERGEISEDEAKALQDAADKTAAAGASEKKQTENLEELRKAQGEYEALQNGSNASAIENAMPAAEVVTDGPNAADAYADRVRSEGERARAREQELIGGAEDALALAGGIQEIDQEREEAPISNIDYLTEMFGLGGNREAIERALALDPSATAPYDVDSDKVGRIRAEIEAEQDRLRPMRSLPISDLRGKFAQRDLDRALEALPESAGPRMTAPAEILSGSGLEELGVRPRLTSPNNPLSRRVEIRDPRFAGEELNLQDIPAEEENFPGDTRDFNAAMDLLPSLERRGRMMPAGAPVATGGPRATQSDEYRVPMFRELPEFPLDMLIRMQQNPPNRADQSFVPLRNQVGPRVENAMGGKTPSVNKLRDMIKKKYGIR